MKSRLSLTFQATRAFLFLVSLFPVAMPGYAQQPQGERQEKWFEQKRELAGKAEEAIKEAPAPAPRLKKRRWRIFGKLGYEYDDNVRLHSNKEGGDLKLPSGDKNAGRYEIESGLGYKFFQNNRTEGEVVYLFSQSFHDDSLDEFNFRDHSVSLLGRRKMRAWGRQALLTLQYRFSHGSLEDRTFSSAHLWGATWQGEWRENFPVTFYERIYAKNFRDKGFNPPDTERDGLYHYTGVIQRYLFHGRRRELSLGYEFGFQATKGNNFDSISNGFRVGLKTPVIEKIKFETNFFFEDEVFHHYSGNPNRHDLRYNYEFLLSRPLLREYLEIVCFYKRTDVNTLHDGILGQFNYNRNLYGVELKFRY